MPGKKLLIMTEADQEYVQHLIITIALAEALQS